MTRQYLKRGNDMAEEIKTVDQTRRSAIKTAAQVAVTAPAVGLLLSGSAKAQVVHIHYGDDTVLQRNDDAGNGSNGDDAPSYTQISSQDDAFYTY